MSNLKELKNRITSVKSTQKITSAMKMVAASRLKRAQEAAEAARPYAERMGRMMASVLGNPGAVVGGSKLLSGTGSDGVHLIVVVTSDRGLCGGFNSSISRASRQRIREQYLDADRQDLADQEQYELDLLQEFLPVALDEAAIAALIDAAIAQTGATSMKDMGKVMGVLKPQVQGRADVGALSATIKAKLQ